MRLLIQELLALLVLGAFFAVGTVTLAPSGED